MNSTKIIKLTMLGILALIILFLTYARMNGYEANSNVIYYQQPYPCICD